MMCRLLFCVLSFWFILLTTLAAQSTFALPTTSTNDLSLSNSALNGGNFESDVSKLLKPRRLFKIGTPIGQPELVGRRIDVRIRADDEKLAPNSSKPLPQTSASKNESDKKSDNTAPTNSAPSAPLPSNELTSITESPPIPSESSSIYGTNTTAGSVNHITPLPPKTTGIIMGTVLGIILIVILGVFLIWRLRIKGGGSSLSSLGRSLRFTMKGGKNRWAGNGDQDRGLGMGESSVKRGDGVVDIKPDIHPDFASDTSLRANASSTTPRLSVISTHSFLNSFSFSADPSSLPSSSASPGSTSIQRSPSRLQRLSASARSIRRALIVSLRTRELKPLPPLPEPVPAIPTYYEGKVRYMESVFGVGFDGVGDNTESDIAENGTGADGAEPEVEVPPYTPRDVYPPQLGAPAGASVPAPSLLAIPSAIAEAQPHHLPNINTDNNPVTTIPTSTTPIDEHPYGRDVKEPVREDDIPAPAHEQEIEIDLSLLSIDDAEPSTSGSSRTSMPPEYTR